LNIKRNEVSVEVPNRQGASLLDLIRSSGLPFAAPCAGKGICGKCKVLVQGEEDTWTAQACKTPAESIVSVELEGSAATLDLKLLHELVPENHYGIAIDLGTSTLEAELVNLDTGVTIATAASMNPQAIYGSDVISRIEAAQAGHLLQLQKLALDALFDMVSQLCAQACLPISSLKDITLAGNTVMQHLACGLQPATIGSYPYQPISRFGVYHRPWQNMPPVWLAPCISGYVGGDVVAGMLSNQKHPSLLIDLGTNGEIALQTHKGSWAAATAAGPVFEGMNISSGMVALPGAVKSAWYNEETDILDLEVVGGGEAQGICGSGLVDIVALMLSHGLVDESGKLLRASESTSPLASRVVLHKGEPAFKLLTHADVVLTQGDIRNLQLAKAAIAAGVEAVLEAAGLTPQDLSSVALAGSLGLHINPRHAAILGLIPPALLGITTSIGNSSLAGARLALLDPQAREHMQMLAQQTQYIELSTNELFTARYLENMGFA